MSFADASAAMSQVSEVLRIRPAMEDDGDAVADLYLASRLAHLPCAPLAYPPADVRRWIKTQLIPSGGVVLAERAGQLLGMLHSSVDDGKAWINQLYLLPGVTGSGIGASLLRHALKTLPRPVWLYTFQRNTGAGRFYERFGFVAEAFGDGSDNEERCPDVLYRLDD